MGFYSKKSGFYLSVDAFEVAGVYVAFVYFFAPSVIN
jgi:hypothetical protein